MGIVVAITKEVSLFLVVSHGRGCPSWWLNQGILFTGTKTVMTVTRDELFFQ
jgi:hypothetical protein